MHKGYRNLIPTNSSQDVRNDGPFVRDRQSPPDGSLAVILHTEHTEFNLFGREIPEQPPPPCVVVNSLTALRYQPHVVAGVYQRNRESEWVSTLYANHIALAPHLKFKFPADFKIRVEMLHYHQHAGGAASELRALRIVRHVEHHLSISRVCESSKSSTISLTPEMFPALHRYFHISPGQP